MNKNNTLRKVYNTMFCFFVIFAAIQYTTDMYYILIKL